MAKRPATAKKTLSAANLKALGADRLADLLMEMAGEDAGWKRRLRMELAAEVGAADLALEIDKRLNTLATSRAKVSWRKRPELISDLWTVRRIIVDRLAVMDARLGLDRLVAWFDLYPGLSARVKDPKGELATMFDAASADLAAVGALAGVEVAAPVFVEALSTRLSEWASWVGRGAAGMEPELARAVLMGITDGKPRPTGRLALVVRKLADRSGDLDAWVASLPDEDRTKPEIGAEVARRLAEAGRAAEARAALEASRPVVRETSRWGRREPEPPPPPPESWLAAEVAVLEAEGDQKGASDARWMLFERTLAEAPLRAEIAKLPDFEDVVALDRAFAHAAAYPDATAGLRFLMNWPALREAGEMVVARAGEIRGSADEVPLWASRLEGRNPQAALALIRSRAVALTRLALGSGGDEVQQLVQQAQALSDQVGDEGQEGFLLALEEAGRPVRRGWR
ncbi:DUF6880 family protein [Brevundimonas sp. NIBR11]|uniref:DUF6880 family protein n=1 Tax=Brevundimonas sp. NIBR11 TaxID=3015999 RepID=UPI0022F084D1|nr:DUF6880 family protein [Brevundimonas sp. NIBR11]WGM29845.1 hypothetical protein KKHFBJBL_00054 [Brevundimonas sp. NIBR11]